MNLSREEYLRLDGDGGDEIGEEIEAEERLRWLLDGGGDDGLQLRHQDAELREREEEVIFDALLRH